MPIDYTIRENLGTLKFDYQIAQGKSTIGLDGFSAENLALGTTEKLVSAVDDMSDLPIYYPTTSESVYLASEDADDTIAGVGAQIVAVAYLDDNFERQTAFVEMDGLTQVLIADNVSRVNALFVTQHGSNVDAEGRYYPSGNIWAGSGVFALGIPANKMRAIPTTAPADRDALYTTPDGIQAVSSEIFYNTASGKAANFTLHIRFFGNPIWYRLVAPTVFENTVIQTNQFLVLPPRTDVQITAKANLANTAVVCQIGLLLFEV